MQHRGKIALLLIGVAACGDSGSMTASTTTTTPTTVTMTADPSSATPSEESESVGGPTTEALTTEGPATVPTSTTPDGTAASEGSTDAPAGAPMFLSFNTNAAKITDGESITFTAILTDPDGVDDIVGGSLLTEDEAIDYGPMAVAGEGTFSISLSWDQLHQAVPIDFETGEEKRVFLARFFDQAGNKATKTVEFSLYCAGGGACEGACKDLGADGANCGTCGRACDAGVDGCVDGVCAPSWSTCVGFEDGLDTCDLACASIQESCVENGCEANNTVMFFQEPTDCPNLVAGYKKQPCGEEQDWSPSLLAVRCCCTDTQ